MTSWPPKTAYQEMNGWTASVPSASFAQSASFAPSTPSMPFYTFTVDYKEQFEHTLDVSKHGIRGFKGLWWNNDALYGNGDYKFEIGKTYEHVGEIGLCKAGFHFCEVLPFCFNFYDPFRQSSEVRSRYVSITAHDEVVSNSYKCVTNKITLNEYLNGTYVYTIKTPGYVRTYEVHFKDGFIHSDTQPAYIETSTTSPDYLRTIKAYCKNGLLHNAKGPAYMAYKNNILVDSQTFIEGTLITP